jgi:RNA polymerase sigma-70 factor (ECF subfamily)
MEAGELRKLEPTAPGFGRRREAALVRAAQSGSGEAMEELFRRHWKPAHRAAYLVVHDAAAAEDIAQEAFISAIRSLDRFDRRRPFGPWLHRIVVNRAIDWTRARSAKREVSGDAAGGFDRASMDPDLAAQVDSGRVIAALAALSPEHRAVVVMRYVLEYTPGEIAELLELPRGTVNSRVRRGLDILAGMVEHES